MYQSIIYASQWIPWLLYLTVPGTIFYIVKTEVNAHHDDSIDANYEIKKSLKAMIIINGIPAFVAYFQSKF